MTVFKNIGTFLGDIFEPILKFIEPALSVVAKGFIWFINVIINAINLVMNVLTLGFWKDIAQIKYPGEEERKQEYTGRFAGVEFSDEARQRSGEEQQFGGIQLQEGGIVSHGIFELGEGGAREAVIPLDQWEKSVSAQTALLGAMHDELMISNSLNRQILRTREWKRAFG